MIICKTPREVDIMREAGRIVALTHQELKKHIAPGITTSELDKIADQFIRKFNAIPSFKGYNGFSGSICTSVNNELVHGIPGDRVLKDGDIISVDIGAKYNGYHVFRIPRSAGWSFDARSCCEGYFFEDCWH